MGWVMPSENLEYRLEDLNALRDLRSALSLRYYERQGVTGRVHALALNLGVWRAGGYAPRAHGSGRGGAKQGKMPGFVPAVGMMMPAIMQGRAVQAYLRRASKQGVRQGAQGGAKKAKPDAALPPGVRLGVPAYLASVLTVPRKRTLVAARGQRFAPVPKPASAAQNRAATGAWAVQPFIQAREQRAGGAEPQVEGQSRQYIEKEGEARAGTALYGVRAQEAGAAGAFDAPAGGAGRVQGGDFADALDDYFFRQSRLAPMGGTAFDPRLSPLWAGLKLPV